MSRCEILEGDCRELLAAMEPDSVDAIVTDPPYGLEFMGKEWDSIGRRTGHHMDPSKEMGAAPATEKGNPWASERPSYGAPKKNPRCTRCNRLKFDHASRRCDCADPRWDTRTREYAQVMQEWNGTWAREAYRVLKPGGHLLAFGGSRTYHRMACAVEDAGFEIRDRILYISKGGAIAESLGPELDWIYGSG